MISPESLVAALNALPPEVVLVLEALVCFAAILAMVRFFGAAGLYAYIVVGVIGANVQVLKAVQFSVFEPPMALGTILFASTYLATDVLTECYGRAAAQRGVMIGFAAFLLWTALMLVTLGYPPLTAAQAGLDMAWALPMQDHLAALFLPVPTLFAASMVSYLISQMSDVWVFERIRRATGGRHLWLRNNGSTIGSALLDTVIFNTLAWIVFAPEPLPLETVLWTYIFSTLWMRSLVAVADTPFIYLARSIVRARPEPAYA